MNIFEALIMGIVQGLTEFLPVSSSGHLLILEKLTGLSESDGGAFFTTMVHIATLVAVIIVYRKMIWGIIRHPINKTLLYLIIATIPTVIIALLYKTILKSFDEMASSGGILGISFLITAILLTLCDYVSTRGKKRDMEKMTVKDALIIGGMQCIGTLPGVSRSGSTISGALFSGLDKSAAADFSFLMSIPAILGSAVLEGKDAIDAGTIGVPVLSLIVGMIAAGVTGYFAVKFMIKLIKNKKLYGFAIYTAALGIIIMIDQYVTHFVF